MKHCMRRAEDATNYKDHRRSSSQVFLAQETTWSITIFPGWICPGSAHMACPTKGIRPCSERDQRLALPSDLFFKSSISQINSKKEKSKKHNTEAWERSGPPASKLFLNTKGRCMCLHDTNLNCWMNQDSVHPQDPLPARGGDPSALCWAAGYPHPLCDSLAGAKCLQEMLESRSLRQITGWVATPTCQAGCVHTSRGSVSPQLSQSLVSAGSREVSGPCPGL